MATKKKKRKARTELIKEVDLLKPIDLTVVGTPDDPCFGKLHDSTHETCRRCGDSEVCAMVYGQTNHIKRFKEESSSNLMDTPDKEPLSATLLSRFIRLRLKKIKKSSVVKIRFAVMARFGVSEKKFDKLLLKVLKKSKNIQLKGDILKYTKTK